jgi:predicted nucleotidyltransferase
MGKGNVLPTVYLSIQEKRTGICNVWMALISLIWLMLSDKLQLEENILRFNEGIYIFLESMNKTHDVRGLYYYVKVIGVHKLDVSGRVS